MAYISTYDREVRATYQEYQELLKDEDGSIQLFFDVMHGEKRAKRLEYLKKRLGL